MDPQSGAKALQCSNPSPVLLNALRASALLFPPIHLVREHSWMLTQKCRELLPENVLAQKGISIITPKGKHKCGAQLSFYFEGANAKWYFDCLHEQNVLILFLLFRSLEI